MLSLAPRVGALVLTLLVTTVATVGGSTLFPSAAQASTWAVPAPDTSLDPRKNLTEFENRVVYRINVVRERRGLRPVAKFDSCVDGLSEDWAAYLASSGEFRHRNQDKVLSRCDMVWAGETLVRGSSLTPRLVVRAWLDSPTHRAVLLKPRANRAGMAVRIDARGRYIGVLNFTDTN